MHYITNYNLKIAIAILLNMCVLNFDGQRLAVLQL